jgi:sporulation-control protein spo0M
MFGKVKKWLGIEGVKIEILLPEDARLRGGVVEGKLRFQSMNTQTVTNIRVAVYEKYSRGRGAEKLIDEYKLGEIELSETFEVVAGEPVEVDFEVPFTLLQSEIDTFGERNLLFRGIAGLAKLSNAVQSTYRIEATAKVKGTAFNPFDSKPLQFK